MLSNATYPAWDADNAAGWSHAIAVSLLRDELGFRGVTITDSLDGTGHARGLPVRVLALRAAVAGTDMVLTTGSERTTTRLFEVLLAHARGRVLARSTLQASYDRILDLKTRARLQPVEDEVETDRELVAVVVTHRVACSAMNAARLGYSPAGNGASICCATCATSSESWKGRLIFVSANP